MMISAEWDIIGRDTCSKKKMKKKIKQKIENNSNRQIYL